MSTATQALQSQEFVTTFRDLLVSQIEREVPVTRKVLANLPNDKRDYRPAPNSRTAWELATHIVSSDIWFLNGIASHSFDFTGEPPVPASDPAALASYYESEVKKALGRIRAMSADDLAKPVPFFNFMTQPASLYLLLAQNHTVHHRGQLSSYLRPIGAKVPDIYGGSFDEPFKG